MVKFLQHGFGEFPDGAKLGPLEWPHFDLFFVHQGEVTFDFQDEEPPHRLIAGQGTLVWPLTRFTWEVAGGGPVRASVQHVQLPRETDGLWAGLARNTHGFSAQRIPASSQLQTDVARAIEQAEADDGSPHWQRIREALLWLILGSGGFLNDDSNPGESPRIDLIEAENVVRKQLARGCSVADVAGAFDLSVSRFRALFRAEHGVSAGAFIRSVRHREIKRLLIETRLPLKEIASRVGLADAVVLGRTFRQDTGETPARFRLKNRIVG